MKISSKVVGDSNDENNFPHKLLLTNTQVSKLRKNLSESFANGSSANMRLTATGSATDAAIHKKTFGFDLIRLQ